MLRILLIPIVCTVLLFTGTNGQTANDFNRYWTYNEIITYINGLSGRFNFVEVDSVMSTELRQIQMVRIRVPHPEGKSKPIVFITSGLIAREWANVMIAVHVIFQLTQNNAAFRDVLESCDVHVIPLLNPDGYVFSHDSDRAWVKNRFMNPNSPCIGVNVNRNFGIGHAGNPNFNDPCSDNFGDRSSMTQVEQRALMNWVRDHWGQTRGYINIEHHGSRLLYPFAHNANINTHNRDNVIAIAEELLTTLNSFTSQPFITGVYSQVFERTTGTAMDQLHDLHSVHRSYAIHPRAAGPNNYDAPPTELMGIINEVFPSVIHFAQIIGNQFVGLV